MEYLLTIYNNSRYILYSDVRPTKYHAINFHKFIRNKVKS